MVYSEATRALPLIAGYAFHKQAASARTGKKWAAILDRVEVSA
jgi:deoxyhypusine synthase